MIAKINRGNDRWIAHDTDDVSVIVNTKFPECPCSKYRLERGRRYAAALLPKGGNNYEGSLFDHFEDDGKTFNGGHSLRKATYLSGKWRTRSHEPFSGELVLL